MSPVSCHYPPTPVPVYLYGLRLSPCPFFFWCMSGVSVWSFEHFGIQWRSFWSVMTEADVQEWAQKGKPAPRFQHCVKISLRGPVSSEFQGPTSGAGMGHACHFLAVILPIVGKANFRKWPCGSWTLKCHSNLSFLAQNTPHVFHIHWFKKFWGLVIISHLLLW